MTSTATRDAVIADVVNRNAFVTIITEGRTAGHQGWPHLVDGRLMVATTPHADRLRYDDGAMSFLRERYPDHDGWAGSFIDTDSIRRIEVRDSKRWRMAWNAEGWDRGHHTQYPNADSPSAKG